MPALAGRILVVGASSGIGRATAIAAAREGARVALAARRMDLLEEAAAEAGGVAIPCDARDADSCEQVVAAAVAAIGGLDGLVYAAGVSPLAMVEQSDVALWHDVLATNVVGAAMVVREALPHLRDTRGTVVLLSSDSAARPWPGLVPYAASKRALEALADGLRAEEPQVTFHALVAGPTLTDFARDWDPERAALMLARWRDEGYLSDVVAQPSEVAARILELLRG